MTEGIASTTVFSLCAELPASLPPAFQTGNAALDTGWLVHDEQRIPCFLGKFSAAGATLRLAEPLDEGAAFALELANGQCIPGTVSWSNGEEAGFLFDAPIDVVGTMARNLAILPAERRRVPRVELHQIVGIRHGDDFEFARTRDLSQAGVGIETGLKLAEDDRVQVAFDGLSPMGAVVKWATAGKAGIAFDAEISWQTLMPWLRQAQTSPGRPHSRARGVEEGPRFGLATNKAVIPLHAAARVREGSRWWNVEVRYLTPHLVEFECATPLAKGTQLWLWLPGFPGWPAGVIDIEDNHYLAEFRLPLRQHDLDTLAPGRIAARGG
jgi:hypothetical protein